MDTKPKNLHDWERLAQQILPPPVYYHISLGAFDGFTKDANNQAWKSFELSPTMMQDASYIDTYTQVLKTPVASPIGIAPMGHSGLAHHLGELAMARGSVGHIYCSATVSTYSIEEIGKEVGAKWFQLYILKDRELTKELIQRAEAAGFGAIVLTIDSPYVGKREPVHIPRQYFGNLGRWVESDELPGFIKQLLDPSITWKDVEWIKSITSLPVVIKGVISSVDFGRADDAGADAIWISNHGGRQLDLVSTTAHLLAFIHADPNRFEVYVDGGIRRGTDALIALALGAKAVFIGRPAMYGLAAGGEDGVRSVLRTLNDELRNAMALLGARSIAEISRDHIW